MFFIEDDYIMPNEDCLICLDAIVNETNEISLNCHCTQNYHYVCLKKWVNERNCCPICKTVVKYQYKLDGERVEQDLYNYYYTYTYSHIFAFLYFYFMTFTMCYIIFAIYYRVYVFLVYGFI